MIESISVHLGSAATSPAVSESNEIDEQLGAYTAIVKVRTIKEKKKEKKRRIKERKKKKRKKERRKK